MEKSKNMDNHISQTTIYIGLNDSETGVQKYDSKKYISILKRTCQHYKLAFAVQTVSGGYFHEDGRYTEENTLMLKLMPADSSIYGTNSIQLSSAQTIL